MPFKGSNLLIVRNKKSMGQAEFATLLGISRQTLGKYEKGFDIPSDKLINGMSNAFTVEELDFVYGRISEIKWNNTTPVPEPSPLNKNASALERKITEVRIVEIKAQAGYLRGFNDPEYLETLPTITVNEKFERGGHYVCFRIDGDSMDDGSKFGLQHADVILARELSKHHWSSKLSLDKTWIIVHRMEGIICKRITKHELTNGTITCHSLNSLYEDFELQLKDVHQLFYVKQLVERQY